MIQGLKKYSYNYLVPAVVVAILFAGSVPLLVMLGALLSLFGLLFDPLYLLGLWTRLMSGEISPYIGYILYVALYLIILRWWLRNKP